MNRMTAVVVPLLFCFLGLAEAQIRRSGGAGVSGLDEPVTAKPPAAAPAPPPPKEAAEFLRSRAPLAAAVEAAAREVQAEPNNEAKRARWHAARARQEDFLLQYVGGMASRIEQRLADLEKLLREWRDDPDVQPRQKRFAELQKIVADSRSQLADTERLLQQSGLSEQEIAQLTQMRGKLSALLEDLEPALEELADLVKTREGEQQALVRSAQAWKHELENHRFTQSVHRARRDAQALLGIEWATLRQRREAARRVMEPLPVMCTLGCKPAGGGK